MASNQRNRQMPPLEEVLPIENVEDYKIHFAQKGAEMEDEPLDLWLENPETIEAWQEHEKQYKYYDKDYVFTLVDFYHEEDTWLFIGIFEVINTFEVDGKVGYEMDLTPCFEEYIGKLKLYHDDVYHRTIRSDLKKYYSGFKVRKRLRERYTG